VLTNAAAGSMAPVIWAGLVNITKQEEHWDKDESTSRTHQRAERADIVPKENSSES
jgi:hypothetical protein